MDPIYVDVAAFELQPDVSLNGRLLGWLVKRDYRICLAVFTRAVITGLCAGVRQIAASLQLN
jgi:hypothetical protein